MNVTYPEPFDLLVDVARGEGIDDSALPAQLLGHRLKPETWDSSGSDAHEERVSDQLPRTVAGARLEGTPVIFGLMAGEPTHEMIRETLRRYLNQTTIARSWLDVDAANLQLFLAAPLGSADNPQWREAAALIEADDRICRKLVWLPPAHDIRASASNFLSRTFLASPWNAVRRADSVALDSLRTIELPEGWDELVGDSSLDAEGLVLRLSEVEDV